MYCTEFVNTDMVAYGSTLCNTGRSTIYIVKCTMYIVDCIVYVYIYIYDPFCYIIVHFTIRYVVNLTIYIKSSHALNSYISPCLYQRVKCMETL